MTELVGPARTYVLGSSAAETQRLVMQADLYDAFTRQISKTPASARA